MSLKFRPIDKLPRREQTVKRSIITETLDQFIESQLYMVEVFRDPNVNKSVKTLHSSLWQAIHNKGYDKAGIRVVMRNGRVFLINDNREDN